MVVKSVCSNMNDRHCLYVVYTARDVRSILHCVRSLYVVRIVFVNKFKIVVCNKVVELDIKLVMESVNSLKIFKWQKTSVIWTKYFEIKGFYQNGFKVTKVPYLLCLFWEAIMTLTLQKS